MNAIPPQIDSKRLISQQATEASYYYLGHEKQADEELQVIYGGEETCARHYDVRRDQFPFYAIEFIQSGRCRLSERGAETLLRSGSVFAYGPSTPHRIENIGTEKLTKHFVCLAGKAVPKLINDLFPKAPMALHVEEYHWIHDLFRMLLDIGKRDKSTTLATSRLTTQLLIERIRQLSSEVAEGASPSTLITYRRCRTELDRNFKSLRNVEELAERCNISRAYLARLFARYDCSSPSKALIRLKMDHAAILLKEGALMIKQIADRVGFEDPLYFSQVFKQYFGLSPKYYAQAACDSQPRWAPLLREAT